MNGRTVSLKTIVERVYMDYGFNYSLTYTEAAEWAGSLLSLLRAPISLETKLDYIQVTDGRGKLPCDLESILTLAYCRGGSNIPVPNSAYVFQGEGSYLADTRIIDPVNRDAVIVLSQDYDTPQCIWSNFQDLVPMRYSTDSFENKYHFNDWDRNTVSDYTYKVNTNYVFPNFVKGVIAIAYLAIPTDDEGYPLIPADERWQAAVRAEIAWKIAFKLMIQDNIKDSTYNKIEFERNWAVGRAEVPDISVDMMESFANSWVRLIPKTHQHSNFFRNLQAPEKLLNHPIRYGY